MTKRYLSLNGKFTEYEKASIHLNSVAIKYGASVFEGIRGYWNKETSELHLFALDAHLNRLFESTKLMRMDVEFFTKNQIIQWIDELVRINNLCQDCYIRCAASVVGTEGIDTCGPILISIDAFSQGRKAKQLEGIKVCISSWIRISDNSMPPRIKCIANYQNGRLAMLQAKSDGYDNVILLNQQGKVSEAPTACIFLVKDEQLITPPVTSSILDSITRRFIIALAKMINIITIERDIDRSECYLAHEAFLCGTGCEILPIISIDQYYIRESKPGDITKRLMLAFDNVVRGKDESFNHLLYTMQFNVMEA